MTPDEHLSDGRLRYRYPTPIAAAYRLSRIARTPAVRLGHILGTIDEAVRFFCWVTLSEYLAARADGRSDPQVDGLLVALEDPSTSRLLQLIRALAASRALENPFLPELLLALGGQAGDELATLVGDAAVVRIDRLSPDLAKAEEWCAALLPRVVSLLSRFTVLEHVLLMRPREVVAGDSSTWYLHPWRGIGGARPVVVHSKTGGLEALRGVRALVVRPGADEALRVDPFIVPGPGGRLLSLLCAPGSGVIQYEHYPSGSVTTLGDALAATMDGDGLQRRIALGLDAGSIERLHNEAAQRHVELTGYSAPIAHAVDENGKHFRAIHVETGMLHNVVRVHRHLVRDSDYLQRVVATARSLEGLEHKNVAPPVHSQFDPQSGCFIVGTPHAEHGRLIDRLPPGFTLPIGWSLDAADGMLAGLEALAERGVSLSALPSWAVSVGDSVQIVPFLAGTEGRSEDGPVFVGRLLYRMLTGHDSSGAFPVAPSLVRKGVPEAVDTVVLGALAGAYGNPATLRADLQAASVAVSEEPPGAELSTFAVQRTFAHLQRLRPGMLETYRDTTLELETSGEWSGVMGSLRETIDAIWDPDERLKRVMRLVEIAGVQDDHEEMQALYRHIIELAGDHLPTLQYAASRYRDAIRGGDLMRLYRRILSSAHTDDDRFWARSDLARLHEERLEMLEAKQAYRELTTLRPERSEGWAGLVRAVRALGEEEQLAVALERLLSLVTDVDERLDLVRELAVLRAGLLGDVRGAITLLREVTAHPKSGVGAWEVMRDLAREVRDDDLLEQALAGLAQSPDVSDSERRSLELERATTLGLRQGRVEEALVALDGLLAGSPEDTVALSYKAQLLERAERWPEAAATLQLWAASETGEAGFVVAVRRLARVSGRQLGETDRAMELYQAVLETEPSDREALAFLEEQYTLQQDSAALAAVLRSQADVGRTREERVALLHRLAALEEESLVDPAAASLTLTILLHEDPRDSAAFERFAALIDAAGTWDDVRDVVDVVLPHLAPERRRELERKLGRLDMAEDVAAAATFFRNAVSADPTDLTALEGLVAATARVGAWAEHAETLRRLIALAETTEARATRQHELAVALRDRVLSPRRAIEVYEQLVQDDPEDTRAWKGLVQTGESAGRTPAERVAALQRWVELCADPGDRLEALEQILSLANSAALADEVLVRCYTEVLALDVANPQALAGLEAHHRSRGDLAAVAGVVRQRISSAGAAEQPGLYEQLIGLQLDGLGDAAAAGATLGQLQVRHAEHEVDADLLERVLVASGRAETLLELLAARADRTLSEDVRADLLARQGRIAADVLGNEAEAVALMERALAQSPQHLGALAFLGDAYVVAEQWRDARPVLQAMVSALDDLDDGVDPGLYAEAWCRLGEVHEQLGEDDLALRSFEQVLDGDPTNIRGLFGKARVARLQENYEEAEAFYQSILAVHGDDLAVEDVALVKSALAEIALARGDDTNSRTLLEHALQTQPATPAVLRDLIGVCERQADWAGAAEYRARLIQTIQDPLERFAGLMDLAEIQRDKLEAFDKARVALEEARELRPDSVGAIVQLLQVYLKLQRYKQAVDALEVLIAREPDPARKARYTYTLATLYRDDLKDPRRAVAFLNETLDLDPGRLEAFEALDQILVQHKDWSGQAASYHAMLSRLEGRPGDDDGLSFRLYRNLARIYRSGLGRPDDAVKALAAALERRPDALDVREELAAALEEQEPDGARALSEYYGILAVNTNHLPAWKALGRIFARQRDRDAAWNVCGVLRLLDKADPKEQAFYARHQKPALALRKALDGLGQWEAHLLAEDQDVLLGRIFEVVGRTMSSNLAQRSLQDLGLGPQDAVSLRQKSRFTNFLGTVSKILQVPIPAVYRSQSVRGIAKEALWPPVMVVGPEVLTGRKGKELRFLLGKAMAYFLPQHALAGLFPVGHLRTLLLGAMRTVMPELSQAGEPGVRGVQKQIEASITRRDVETLRGLCIELTDRAALPNLNAWLSQVERTANHAGHLLCNDIEVSVRLIKEERQHGARMSKLTRQEAIEDLARFTVSPRYLALRRELGAAITE
ncbi:MAG: tetratricopeptide (TPR) repeat protein [Myxococcota bacterium]